MKAQLDPQSKTDVPAPELSPPGDPLQHYPAWPGLTEVRGRLW